MSDLIKRIQQWGRRYDEECVTDAGQLLSDSVDEIKRLQQESDELSEKCGEFEQQVEDIYKECERLQRENEEANTRCVGLTSKIARLEAMLDRLADGDHWFTEIEYVKGCSSTPSINSLEIEMEARELYAASHREKDDE